MFEKILSGIKQRYTAASNRVKASWLFDQITSLTNVAFGAAGAVLMATKIPKLTAALTSVVALNSATADVKAIQKHWSVLPTGARVGVITLEGVSLVITAAAIIGYCTTTIETGNPCDSVSDAQNKAAQWNTVSAAIAYLVSPLLRKIIGSCATSLEAVEKKQREDQEQIEIQQRTTHIADLTRERDMALGQVATLTGERDTTLEQVTAMTGERDKALGQVATLTGELDTAREQVTALTGERDTTLEQVTAMTGERDKTLGQVVTLTGELDTARKQVTALTEERNTVRIERDAIQTAFGQAQMKTAALTGELDTLKKQIAALTAKLVAAQTTIEQQQIQVSALTASSRTPRFFSTTESPMPQTSSSDIQPLNAPTQKK